MTTQLGNTGRQWLRVDLPVEQRVESLLTEMTLAEKVGQTHQIANIDPSADHEIIRNGGLGSALVASGATAGNERDAGVLASAIDAAQRIAVEESRLAIPLLFGRDVIHGHRTVFPIPLGLAAAWDEDLVFRTARLAAREASMDGVAWTFAPMLDISEEPRWGRVAESLGEAPVLAGRLGAAMGGSIEVSVDVTNTGERRGREVVQLYLRDVVADVTRPLLELADWMGLVLDAGATGTATFTVTPAQLAYYDRTMTLRIDPGEALVTVGPDASRGASARITVTE